jgi:K+-sensing histidine kinase KdpD
MHRKQAKGVTGHTGEIVLEGGPMGFRKRQAREQEEREKDADAGHDELRKLLGLAMQEMKHPLTSIKGYSMTLKEYWGDLEEGKKKDYVNFIDISASRLEWIHQNIYRLLALKTTDTQNNPLPVDIREIMDEAVQTLEAFHLDKGVQVSRMYAAELPIIQADPSRLFDIFYNVLDSLFRYSGRGDLISIRANIMRGEMIIILQVGGAGFPADRFKELARWHFEDTLTDEVDSSTAFSLYMARMMLETQKGSMRAEESSGGGTSIYLSLPVGNS